MGKDTFFFIFSFYSSFFIGFHFFFFFFLFSGPGVGVGIWTWTWDWRIWGFITFCVFWNGVCIHLFLAFNSGFVM